jgi:hypothetical protein
MFMISSLIFRYRRANAFVLLPSLVFLASDIAPAADLPKVTHYELRVHIVPTDERLTAEARITVSNPTASAWREIPFLLYRLLAVDGAEDEHNVPLSYRQTVVSMSDEKNCQVNSVALTLREPLLAGGTTKITLKYSGAIFGYPEVMPYVREHIGEDYTLLRPDALAYPILAEPSFRSFVATVGALFTYDLEITVPSGTQVACGGLPRGNSVDDGTETFRFASRLPTFRMDIAAAKFKVVKNDAGNLAVYALPEDVAGAPNLLKEMQRVIAFYTSWFGPSPKAAAYTVIEVPEGYGSQASDFYILLVAGTFKDPKRVDEVYHEIGHAWNPKVKPEIERTRWFDEAFASYFEALALREFQGQKAFDDQMAGYREHFRDDASKDSRNATTPIADYGKEELGENSYTKGAWSLYVLNQIVGDEQFKQIIRTVLREFSDRPADFKDFQDVAARVSQRDLSCFYHEWIFGAESSKLLQGNSSIQEIVQRYREAPQALR